MFVMNTDDGTEVFCITDKRPAYVGADVCVNAVFSWRHEDGMLIACNTDLTDFLFLQMGPNDDAILIGTSMFGANLMA